MIKSVLIHSYGVLAKVNNWNQSKFNTCTWNDLYNQDTIKEYPARLTINSNNLLVSYNKNTFVSQLWFNVYLGGPKNFSG